MIVASLRRTIAHYNRLNDAFPLLTQAGSAGVVAAVGDLLMQRIEGVKEFDFKRTGRLVVYRTMFFAPIYSVWLHGLEKYVKFSGSAMKAVATKVALEQVVWAPPSLTMFYMVMNMLEGGSWRSGWERVQNLLPYTLKINYGFWIPVQGITFALIPPQHRVLWVSLVQVGWNAWLSGVNNTHVASRESKTTDRVTASS